MDALPCTTPTTTKVCSKSCNDLRSFYLPSTVCCSYVLRPSGRFSNQVGTSLSCSCGIYLLSMSRDKSPLPIFSAGPVISWSIVVRRSFATANNDFRYNLMKVNKDSEAQPVERNITTQTTILAFLTIYCGSGRGPLGQAFSCRLSVFQGFR